MIKPRAGSTRHLWFGSLHVVSAVVERNPLCEQQVLFLELEVELDHHSLPELCRDSINESRFEFQLECRNKRLIIYRYGQQHTPEAEDDDFLHGVRPCVLSLAII